MAGGGVEIGGPGKRAHLYEHKFSWYFVYTCFVGALGGSLFGYDLGVSGFLFLSLIISICSILFHFYVTVAHRSNADCYFDLFHHFFL